MHGTVRRLGEDEIEIEIAPGTVVRFVKSAIARRLVEDDVEDVEEIGDTGEGNA
jgi:preprotein translocase subunit YajC